jgi:hypothetical protein
MEYQQAHIVFSSVKSVASKSQHFNDWVEIILIILRRSQLFLWIVAPSCLELVTLVQLVAFRHEKPVNHGANN